jgi:hypothetical protein
MELTKDRIVALLNTNPLAVERAIIAIYNRQTQDEKQASDTKHTNGRGFRSNHATRGSYYARWILGGRHLTGHHLDLARSIAVQYHRQLIEVAIEKEENERERRKEALAAH